jgi:hypothetical protein
MDEVQTSLGAEWSNQELITKGALASHPHIGSLIMA